MLPFIHFLKLVDCLLVSLGEIIFEEYSFEGFVDHQGVIIVFQE